MWVSQWLSSNLEICRLKIVVLRSAHLGLESQKATVSPFKEQTYRWPQHFHQIHWLELSCMHSNFKENWRSTQMLGKQS